MADEIRVSDEDDISLPLMEVLTGRGFITGKSGSGKSNTTSVIVEEILATGQPMLIIDTDGEYWGLKEQYQMLHLGADDTCDVQVTADHAEIIVTLALEEEIPTILDVSAFLSSEDATTIINRVVTELFRREKRTRKPFLLIAEEVHEYIPEGGGLDDAGETLIQVAKRGRKHGLGLLGVSQRPASVDKNFITQCDWIVWHRLTWKNDTKVVGKILGKDAGQEVQHLDTGEGMLMTDWDEQLRRTQFRKKRTYDAGATPGMGTFDPPPLVPVPREILGRFDKRAIVDPEKRMDDGPADEETATDEATADASADGDEDAPATGAETDDPDANPEDADGEPPAAETQAVPDEAMDADEGGDGGTDGPQEKATEPNQETLADSTSGEGSVEVVESNGGAKSAPAEVVPSQRQPREARPVGRAPRTGTPNQPMVVEFGEMLLHVGRRTSDKIGSLVRRAGTALTAPFSGKIDDDTVESIDASDAVIFLVLAFGFVVLIVALVSVLT